MNSRLIERLLQRLIFLSGFVICTYALLQGHHHRSYQLSHLAALTCGHQGVNLMLSDQQGVLMIGTQGRSDTSHGLLMLLDGAQAKVIARGLEREIEAMTERQTAAVAILRRAADVAPAMGLIGTLIGLVQMLGHLEDPEQIGPAMAIALLTTLYGAHAKGDYVIGVDAEVTEGELIEFQE